MRVALAVILAILAAAPAGARTVTYGTDAGGPLVGDLVFLADPSGNVTGAMRYSA